MTMNKMSNFTKSRKFHLLLCCVMLFGFLVGTRTANSAAPPKGIAVQTFLYLDFPNNPQCWTVNVSGTNVIQYTNGCGSALPVDVLVTHTDGTTEDFLMAPSGRLLFLGGSPGVVHIIKEQ